mmetsp:Transcript_6413/g.23761  ORF Transcript_6413/g.23761 Transcript_6413/m.23761 type:complete len:991 (+) Transcript_6413:77-3049(+)
MLRFLCIAALLLCGGLVVPASGELTWIPFSELQAQVEQLVEEGTISAAQGNAVLADAYEMHLKQVADDAQRELEEAVEEVEEAEETDGIPLAPGDGTKGGGSQLPDINDPSTPQVVFKTVYAGGQIGAGWRDASWGALIDTQSVTCFQTLLSLDVLLNPLSALRFISDEALILGPEDKLVFHMARSPSYADETGVPFYQSLDVKFSNDQADAPDMDIPLRFVIMPEFEFPLTVDGEDSTCLWFYVEILLSDFFAELSTPTMSFTSIQFGNVSPIAATHFILRDLNIIQVESPNAPAPAPEGYPVPESLSSPEGQDSSMGSQTSAVKIYASAQAQADPRFFGKYSAAIIYESDIKLDTIQFNVREANGRKAQLTSIQTASDMAAYSTKGAVFTYQWEVLVNVHPSVDVFAARSGSDIPPTAGILMVLFFDSLPQPSGRFVLENVEINDELQPVVVNSMKIDLAMPMPIPAPLLEPKSVSVFDGSLQGEWEFEGTSGVSVSVIDETLGGTFSGNVISAFLDLFATLRIGLQEPTKEDRFTSGVLSFYVRSRNKDAVLDVRIFTGFPGSVPGKMITSSFVLPTTSYFKYIEIPFSLAGADEDDLLESVPSLLEFHNTEDQAREIVLYDIALSTATSTSSADAGTDTDVSTESGDETALPSPADIGVVDGTSMPSPVAIPGAPGSSDASAGNIFGGIFSNLDDLPTDDSATDSATLSIPTPAPSDPGQESDSGGPFAGIFGGELDNKAPNLGPPPSSASPALSPPPDAGEQDKPGTEPFVPNIMAIVGATPSSWMEKCPFDCQFVFGDMVAVDGVIRGSDDCDCIFAGERATVIYGGAGDDWIFSGSHVTHVYGESGADVIFGSPSSDTLYGGPDGDVIYAGDSSDVVYGGLGDDTLFGQSGDDALYGGFGKDLLLGGEGDDVLFGEAGADTLSGGDGQNLLVGGPGADSFISCSTDDKLEEDAEDLEAVAALAVDAQLSAVFCASVPQPPAPP